MSLGSSEATAGAGFLVGTAKPTGVFESAIFGELMLDESGNESAVCEFGGASKIRPRHRAVNAVPSTCRVVPANRRMTQITCRKPFGLSNPQKETILRDDSGGGGAACQWKVIRECEVLCKETLLSDEI